MTPGGNERDLGGQRARTKSALPALEPGKEVEEGTQREDEARRVLCGQKEGWRK